MVTSRGETRGRVVRTAAGLFRRQGYHATGLNQVLAEGQAPKGSLYFHFPGGKEQLGVEAVAMSGAELGSALAQVLARARSAEAGIVALGRFFAESLRASDYQAGCPVATIALDVAASSDPIREACDAVYSSWISALARRFEDWGLAPAEASSRAVVVIAGMEGALVLARVRRDASVVTDVARELASGGVRA